MRFMPNMRVFTERYPIIGSALWILSFQYFLNQIIVALAWKLPYSISQNAISDLGNTACGVYVQRFVCSPRHALMNGSFIALGLTMILGCWLIYQEFQKKRHTVLGFGLMGLSGLGTALVGLFPENVLDAAHLSGAFIAFLSGGIGIIVLGRSLDVPKALKIYSTLTGVICLAALGVFLTGQYLGLGIGGMERLVSYPQTIWLIVFGIYISKDRFLSVLTKTS